MFALPIGTPVTNMTTKPKRKRRTSKAAPSVRTALQLERAAASDIIWPRGAEIRYGVSKPTIWRWERTGRLPPRDVNLNGKTGWRRSTLLAAEQSAA
jgi:predicted DNA-binding transcriptional regulator AlpA